MNIQFYTTPAPYDIPVSKLLSLNGKEVTGFIVSSDDGPSPGSLYFAGYTPDGLSASSRWLTKHVADEVANQKRIAAHFAQPSAFKDTPMDARVKKLIAGMSSEKTQFQSFADLEALGKEAVPATIRWMDNQHSLAVPHISLRNNSPQAFEGTRQYGPKVVVDALAAILNQVTKESFGFIYNNSSDTFSAVPEREAGLERDLTSSRPAYRLEVNSLRESLPRLELGQKLSELLSITGLQKARGATRSTAGAPTCTMAFPRMGLNALRHRHPKERGSFLAWGGVV